MLRGLASRVKDMVPIPLTNPILSSPRAIKIRGKFWDW